MRSGRVISACASAFLSGAALLLTTVGASAFVVCNDKGDCWHASERYVVPKEHVTFYDDKWDWNAHSYRWHDAQDGPGYWDSDSNKWVSVKKVTTTTTTTTTAPDADQDH